MKNVNIDEEASYEAVKKFCPNFPIFHKFSENLINKKFSEKNKIVNEIYFISINIYKI